MAKISATQDRFFANRAAELAQELEWQIYWRQVSLDKDAPEQAWLNVIFDMVADIRLYAMPGLSVDDRPEYRSLSDYREQFRGL